MTGSCDHSEKIRDSNSGETYCQSCGLILEEDKVDTSSDPVRHFTAEEEEDAKQHGEKITYAKKNQGIVTQIGRSKAEIAKSNNPFKYYRLSKWQDRNEENLTRGMKVALRQAKLKTSCLNLPDKVEEEVCRLYMKCYEEDLVRGRKQERVVAALIYLVARRFDVPRTLYELSEFFEFSSKKIGQEYKRVKKELGIYQNPVKPVKLLPRYADKIGLNPGEVSRCRKVLKNARENAVMVGRKPSVIVAGAIYYTLKYEMPVEDSRISQPNIARVCGVTEVSVRKSYKVLENHREEVKP